MYPAAGCGGLDGGPLFRASFFVLFLPNSISLSADNGTEDGIRKIAKMEWGPNFSIGYGFQLVK
ncbi:MAG: hypothetical protein ACI8WB_000183 [Phenylobacterium sp.]|jgi:hypothetical protein